MKEKKIILAIGQIFLVGIFSFQSIQSFNGLSLFNNISTSSIKSDSIKISSYNSESENKNLDYTTNNDSEYFDAVASWYGAAFDGRKMANGEVFNMYNEKLVAHKKLPFGTKLEIVNPDNNAVLYATVTDRGPYITGRDFDLSYAGAQKLGMLENGVKKLKVRIIE